jgi:hypothetical protein
VTPPVTDADRAVERALRERIAVCRPGDGVLGEEEGDDGGTVRWIIDPIDGTKNFSRGVPIWATLIALEREGARLWRHLRAGARAPLVGITRRGSVSRRLPNRRVRDIPPGRRLRLFDVCARPRCRRTRRLARAFAWRLLATRACRGGIGRRSRRCETRRLGLLRADTDRGGEAGGRVSALDGGPPRPKDQVVTSNGFLHDELLAVLSQQ